MTLCSDPLFCTLHWAWCVCARVCCVCVSVSFGDTTHSACWKSLPKTKTPGIFSSQGMNIMNPGTEMFEANECTCFCVGWGKTDCGPFYGDRLLCWGLSLVFFKSQLKEKRGWVNDTHVLETQQTSDHQHWIHSSLNPTESLFSVHNCSSYPDISTWMFSIMCSYCQHKMNDSLKHTQLCFLTQQLSYTSAVSFRI